jgi:predicted ATP-grasp superfamily ATP-dependent carboligase
LSRYATTIFDWDWNQPISKHGEELANRLIQYAKSQPEPPVLFYYWDEPLLFLSRYRKELAQAFRFVIPDAKLVEALVDKARFWALAEELSLPVPATRILLSGSAQPPDVSPLGYPLIIKPYRRDRLWESVGLVHKAKALRVDTIEEFYAAWPRLSAIRGAVIAQQYIDGPESSVESYHVYVDQHGEIAGEFTGRKIRTLPLEYGHTTALTITDAVDVAHRGRELVRVLGLRGVAKFDFKRGPDGQLYLLEVNPRFNLWHHPGARAGVNLPALVYTDLTGYPRLEVMQPPRNVSWCHPKDFLAAREAGVPCIQWLPWALRCEAKAFWDRNDPMPFVRSAVSYLLSGGTV